MSAKSSLTALKKKGSSKLKCLHAADAAQYWWHPAHKIGKGSFGEVFKGWEERPGCHVSTDVAIKMIKKEYIDQDPKVQENLQREIDIMKMLSDCTYSVRLHNVMDTKTDIVLAMELCDCDLDQFVKDRPFGENNVKTFLHQMSEGIKVLQKHQIVHRDLKPSNILIKSTSHDNFVIKLADFGFARQFTTNMDMTSLAGTPVFMAPEALRCIFHKGKKYDEKVDLWSIGALLYKVIVGQCGFYANLQDILTVLEKKGDAIAHVRSSGVYCPKYIAEFSDDVEKRLSPYFKKKIEELLVKLLKLEPSERMTFQEFFDFVDDLIKSKLTVINVQDGIMIKTEFDKQLTLEQLKVKIEQSLGVTSAHQLLVHQVDDSHPVNLSSLQQHQFQQHIISLRPDQENPIYLLSTSIARGNRRTNDVMKLIENARDDPMRGVKMIKEERLTEAIIQSLHAHPTSLESSFNRQIAAVDQIWKFIVGERQKSSSQRVDYIIGTAETNCHLTIESLENFINCFTGYVDHEVVERCEQEKQLLERLQEEVLNKHENLQDISADCKLTNSIHLSPTLISKNLTKLLTNVKKLPKCSMHEVQDQFDDIYKQYVELNDIIDQHVSIVIREVQRAYNAIKETQRLQDDLQQFCYNTETRALKIREYQVELYELLQNKMKEPDTKPVTFNSSVKDQGSDNEEDNKKTRESNPESTLVATGYDPTKSYDFVSSPGEHNGDHQHATVTSVQSTSHVVIDSDQLTVGSLVLLLPTPHGGQLFVAHTKSYFIFLDKCCLPEFNLSPDKPANNPIAGVVTSQPVQHYVNRDDSSSESDTEYRINPNVKSYYTIQCKNPEEITIKGRPSPKLKRKRNN